MNGLNNLYETYREYSLATVDDLTRYLRSKVKVSAGHQGDDVGRSPSTSLDYLAEPAPCGPGAIPYISSLPHLLLYLLVSFTFSFFPFLRAASIFGSVPSHSTTSLPTSFPGRMS